MKVVKKHKGANLEVSFVNAFNQIIIFSYGYKSVLKPLTNSNISQTKLLLYWLFKKL